MAEPQSFSESWDSYARSDLDRGVEWPGDDWGDEALWNGWFDRLFRGFGVDAWKRAVDQMKIEGTHVYSPGGWNATVAKHFRVNSIPRYMLIDKSGKIVMGNAKRPSDPAIYDEIKNLL